MNPLNKLFRDDILFESTLMGYGRISTAPEFYTGNGRRKSQMLMHNRGDPVVFYFDLSTNSVNVKFLLLESSIKKYYKDKTKLGERLAKLYAAIP